MGLADDLDHRFRPVEPAEVVAPLREHARPTGLTAGFGGTIGLVDILMHHRDVRRPLGLPRTAPEDRLRLAPRLTVTAPAVRGSGGARGARHGRVRQ